MEDLYGARSKKNKKLIEEMQKEVDVSSVYGVTNNKRIKEN